MQLQPRPTNPLNGDVLEPVDGAPLQVHESLHPYFGQEESPILHYLRLLRKRCWWILATLAIVFALSVITTLRATRLYQATSKIAVFPENPNVLGFKDFQNDSPAGPDYDVALQTQAEILRSDAIAIQVINTMHLYQDPRFTGIKAPAANSDDVIHSSNVEPD